MNSFMSTIGIKFSKQIILYMNEKSTSSVTEDDDYKIRKHKKYINLYFFAYRYIKIYISICIIKYKKCEIVNQIEDNR